MGKIVGVIPARYESSRFPGKPLIDIAGKTMIQRVYEQASKAKSLDMVVVATDDDRIFNHVKSFGGEVVMTDPNHQSGTERCQEAYKKIAPDANVVVNIQGDEPFIDPLQIELVTQLFQQEKTQLGTLIKKIIDQETLFNNNTPKVVVGAGGKAIYFSRQTIPFLRDVAQENWLQKQDFYKHIGIYAYRTSVLDEIVQLPESPLEKSEKLEQLRWLENGYEIFTAITEIETIGIDTKEDLEKIKSFV